MHGLLYIQQTKAHQACCSCSSFQLDARTWRPRQLQVASAQSTRVALNVETVSPIVLCADLRDCRAIRDILGTVLLIGNFLNAVSIYFWQLSAAVCSRMRLSRAPAVLIASGVCH